MKPLDRGGKHAHSIWDCPGNLWLSNHRSVHRYERGGAQRADLRRNSQSAAGTDPRGSGPWMADPTTEPVDGSRRGAPFPVATCFATRPDDVGTRALHIRHGPVR